MEPEKGMIEDHFPTPNEAISATVTESDPKAIHDKLNSYEKLDTEQRYKYSIILD